MKRLSLLLSTFLLLMSFSAPMAFATGMGLNPDLRPNSAPTISGNKEDPYTNFDEARVKLTQRVVNIVLGVAGVIAVYFIVNSGFALVISSGSEEAVTQHKKSITWALLGLLLIILSYSIITFVIKVTLTADQSKTPPAATYIETIHEKAA
ncbi:hypothetical protein KBD59_01260 [Candidatus Gracilibacteria bacterium]|nr:hypothetical protein [Candidatus Gracilibacteria bacterium]